MKHSALSAKEVAEESLRIAGEICVYTNASITVLEL
jgi:ATP-dependent protease HslVU (ClpYQ) peptidase subunit